MSAARHPARGPREPRERGVARGWWPPRGRTPRTPRTPRAPLGARGRARVRRPRRRGRHEVGRWPTGARGGFAGGDRWAAGPTASRFPKASRGRGGTPRAVSRSSASEPHPPSSLPCLSRYPTRTPSAASGHVHTRSRRPSGPRGRSRGQHGPRGRCHHERTTDAGTNAVPGVPSRRPYDPFPLGMPLGGMERPRRAVRFARSIHRRGRVLGGPAVRAAPGGSLSLT